jgi:hypothetical protein
MHKSLYAAVLGAVVSLGGTSAADAGGTGWQGFGNWGTGCGCSRSVAYVHPGHFHHHYRHQQRLYVVNQGPVYSGYDYPNYIDEGSSEPYPYVHRASHHGHHYRYDGGPYRNPLGHYRRHGYGPGPRMVTRSHGDYRFHRTPRRAPRAIIYPK